VGRVEKVPGFPPPGWESQYQRLDGEEVSDDYIRDVAAHIALSCVGMGNDDPELIEAMYPWDMPGATHSMVFGDKKNPPQTKCALFVLMVLRACGFELPEDGKALSWRFGFWKPPAGMHAPEDPMTQLQKLEAYRQGMRLVEPGGAIIIKRPGDTKGLSTHALVVLGYEDGGHKVVSADGGTGKVKQVVRDVVQMGGDLCLRDPVMGNRRILGTIDPADMRSRVVRDYYLPAA